MMIRIAIFILLLNGIAGQESTTAPPKVQSSMEEKRPVVIPDVHSDPVDHLDHPFLLEQNPVVPISVYTQPQVSDIAQQGLPISVYTQAGAPDGTRPPLSSDVNAAKAKYDSLLATLNKTPKAPASAPSGGSGGASHVQHQETNNETLPHSQQDDKQHPKQSSPHFSQSNSVSYSSSDSNGPGKRQCSFSVSRPNKYSVSTDGFGYPKFMVESAAKRNPLAIEMFKKYESSPNDGDKASAAVKPIDIPNIGGIGLGGIPSIGSGPSHNEGPHGFENMFDQIGKRVDNSGIGGFAHGQPQFPDHVIQPSRQFGFNSPLKSTFPNHGSFGGFGGISFRKKRQAIPNGVGLDNQVQSACAFTTDYIRSFKKDNSVCYLYKPEVQGFKMAKCSYDKCRGCGGGGSSRCVEQTMPAWVWSYCQRGAQEQDLTLQFIEYPAYCVCKTIEC